MLDMPNVPKTYHVDVLGAPGRAPSQWHLKLSLIIQAGPQQHFKRGWRYCVDLLKPTDTPSLMEAEWTMFSSSISEAPARSCQR